ncbi:MAG TPA: tripartite tricarboxylate transporter substrate binding protein [Acetobacteraceae bacterium]|nr:tripartite tricarboxylate transporter substrate binding protein [Acetobacteraceae bacterium]
MWTAARTSTEPSRRALIAAALALPALARGQGGFPDRPVRFVVPYSAGGGTDVTAREVAQRLSPLLGQPVIIENRTGANTAVGAEHVARARPDGYTLYFAGASSVVVPPLVWRRLPYGPQDFAPVSLILKQPYGMGVGPWAASSVPDLIERMRAAPGTYSFGHTGTGGIGHLLGERLMAATNTRMVSVPYRGFAQTVVDIIGRRLQMTFEAVNNILSFHRDGSVRVLAITSDRRVPQLPDVPTFTEIGLPQMEVVSWLAVFAPAATPAPVVARLSEAIRTVVDSPSFRDYALSQVQFAEGSTPEALRDYMARDIEAWRRVIEPLNLQVE